MLHVSNPLRTVALSTVALFFTAAPAQAQTGVVAVGHGTYQSPTTPNVTAFTFTVREANDGSTDGLVVVHAPTAIILATPTSHMRIGGSLLFAGEIFAILGSDPNLQVGQTAFAAVNDNGPGSTDGITGFGVIPLAFGNPTIQQIVAILGPPPPQDFRPLLSGNIWVR